MSASHAHVVDEKLLELLRISSRTFAVGIERLPAGLREVVQTAYLLLRISDYLEDNEHMPPARKAEMLRRWDQLLVGHGHVPGFVRDLALPDPLTPDAHVAASAAEVLGALAALPPVYREPVTRRVRESTRGMARWAERGPDIRDEADLDDYMHEVAGRVGYLLTEVFAAWSPLIRRRQLRLMPLAREFGLGLQTVNVLRGLPKDFERGWIYVPQSFAAAHGLPREALFDPAHRRAALAVVDRLAVKAGRHLEAARRYVELLPPRHHRLRLFCVLPLLFAVRTLAISRGNEAVLRDEAKIGRDEVEAIVAAAARWAWSNAWIRTTFRRLAG